MLTQGEDKELEQEFQQRFEGLEKKLQADIEELKRESRDSKRVIESFSQECRDSKQVIVQLNRKINDLQAQIACYGLNILFF